MYISYKKSSNLICFRAGWYDLPEGIVYSLPVKFQKGTWEVCQDIDISEDVQKTLKAIADELIEEKEAIFPPLHVSPPPRDNTTDEENQKKVFGQDEMSKAANEDGKIEDNGQGVVKPVGEDDGNIGPMSKIIEESDVDSKEGERTTDTEKSAEEA